MKHKTAGLLDDLAAMAGCDYLSDLRFPRFWGRARRALEAVRPADYPLREWNDAVEYLTEEPRSFDAPEQAAAYLLRALAQKEAFVG